MQAIEAVYDGVSFKPKQMIPVSGQYEVFIIFVKPVNQTTANLPEPDKLPRSTAKGFLKDKVWMSDDFNEPLT